MPDLHTQISLCAVFVIVLLVSVLSVEFSGDVQGWLDRVLSR